MKNLTLFITAWAQVFLVSVNTWQISHGHLVGAVIVGFLISLVWSFNIKRIAFANNLDRIIYCSGACLGTASGLTLSQLIYK